MPETDAVPSSLPQGVRSPHKWSIEGAWLRCYSASLSAGMVFDIVSDRTWECLMCFLKGMCFIFVSGKNEMMK